MFLIFVPLVLGTVSITKLDAQHRGLVYATNPQHVRQSPKGSNKIHRFDLASVFCYNAWECPCLYCAAFKVKSAARVAAAAGFVE